MMLPVRDKIVISNSTTSFSANLWFYLSVEFLIGVAIFAIVTFLSIIKSFLPKPPRDLTGDVVLIAGATSSLGEYFAEEFARAGCSVICIDNDLESLERIVAKLRSRWDRKVEEIGPSYRKCESQNTKSTMMAYECDLLNRNTIRQVAKKIEDEVGGIDILVTCAGLPNQDIFHTATTTLMSHYWTVLAFLPSMLRRDKAHIVGVTPVTSNEDAYLVSRAAIAGLMESLGQELSSRSSHFTFLAVSPTAESSSLRQSEQEVASEVVQAVRRNQCSLNITWRSKIIYQISCVIYRAITTVTQWLHTQGCDYSL